MAPIHARGGRPDLFDLVRQAAAGLPGVEEGMSYSTRALRVKGKFLVRLREDGESLVIKVQMIEREHLMRADPDTFYITDHYRDYPAVLIHLSKVKHAVLRELIEQAWRRAAPKRLLAAWDAQQKKPGRRVSQAPRARRGDRPEQPASPGRSQHRR